jgi:hypothetical protein
MNRIIRWTAMASSAAALALLAGCAQHGMGHGMGGGQMMGSGTGGNMGMGHGMGMMADEANTPGWSMMTPEERDAHRSRMRSATTREECERLMTEHHQRMVDRAKERSLPSPAGPRAGACPGMAR